MDYRGAALDFSFYIEKLYSVHYFEYPKDFSFHGESHDFWEFVYVDKGEVFASADNKEILLSQGNIIFHKPNEWHNIRSNGKIAPNVAIVSFSCHSEAMNFFKDRVLTVDNEQKTLIAKIISEYTNAFSSPLNDLFSKQLDSKENPLVGSKQLISQYICQLLITFLRSGNTQKTQAHTFMQNHSNASLNIILNYMSDHISENVTIEDLVMYSGLNRMGINRLFNSNFSTSPIQYFIKMKIELAKKLIREDSHNISQIAELLGYSSIHYFSLQFKKITGMTPSQYSSSIKAMSPLGNTADVFSPILPNNE